MAGHTRATVTAGEEVFTRDGEQLGVVKEVRGLSHFKVDAPRARDYWLACELILDSTDRRVTMDFDAADSEAYQLEEPTPMVANDPRIDAGTNDGLSDGAREHRQEAMQSGYPDKVSPPSDLKTRGR